MVSFATLATAVVAVFALSSTPTTLAQQEPVALAVGTYYHPPGALVSNVTRKALLDAAMTHFNLDAGLAAFVTNPLPKVFNLDLLGTHGFIEHDASLVHDDTYFGGDPAFASGPLLEDFLCRASAVKPFSIQTLGEVRRDRIAACKAFNPNCLFGGQASFLAFGEAVFVVKLFGDGVSNTASLANVRSFLVKEKFPMGFTKLALLSMAILAETSALIQAVANA